MQLLKNKVLVTGAHGLLGSNLVAQLLKKYEVYALDQTLNPEFAYKEASYLDGDIARRKTIVEIVKSIHPKFIINAAAYTNVDKSETEREVCWRANVEGVENLALAARSVGARLIHVSTDYVFDGDHGPYRESDRPNPLGFYGKSKLAGENVLLAAGVDYAIARTMVLYGSAPGVRMNFVTWLIDQLRKKQPVRVVDDQFGNPTLADELAAALIKLAESDKQDIYHISGKEIIDRYHFTLKIAEVFDLEAQLVHRIKTADLQQAAPRPLRSGFLLDKVENELGIMMSDAKTALLKFKQKYNS